MCTSPLHIKRPLNSQLSRFAKTHEINVSSADNYVAYDVPCGKCAECRQQRITDYVVRCMHDYLENMEMGLFCTLTYADPYLPIIENFKNQPIFVPNDNVPGEYEVFETEPFKFVSTWYKPHVTKFLKQLNERLIYYVGTNILGLKRLVTINGKRCISDEWKDYLSTSPRPLKYLVSCERGSSDMYTDDYGNKRFGTARPHYHVIFIITDIRLFEFLPYIEKLIQKLWIYGNAYNLQIEHGNEKRTPMQCIEYVCKYVMKDLDETTLTSLFSDHSDEINRKPFLLVSHHLGETLLNDKNINYVLEHGLTLPAKNGSVRHVNPPRYNVQKHTTFRIVGETSVDFKTHFEKGVFFDCEHPSPIFILDEDAYDKTTITKPIRHIKVIKTDIGQSVDINNKIKKASYYASKLFYFQNSQTLKPLWKEQETPLFDRDYFNDIDILKSVDPDDLYLFILNDLYYKKDQYDNPDTMYMAFNIVRDILNTLKIRDRKKRDLIYKLGLIDAMAKRPDLFVCTPI